MSKKVKVALQLSVGGLGDKSFNDSAFGGLEEAQRKFGINYEYATWQNIEANGENIENWAKSDIDLIISVGFGNAAAVAKIAPKYPDKLFAVVDYATEGNNVWSATYREYEGDFVVGVLAALVTQTRIVGFMAGALPHCRRIELALPRGKKRRPRHQLLFRLLASLMTRQRAMLAQPSTCWGPMYIYQVLPLLPGAIETAKIWQKDFGTGVITAYCPQSGYRRIKNEAVPFG